MKQDDFKDIDYKDLKTLDTVSETEEDGTPLGASDVPLEGQKAEVEAKLATGVHKLKDLEEKALSVERELEARGLDLGKEKERGLERDQEPGIEFER